MEKVEKIITVEITGSDKTKEVLQLENMVLLTTMENEAGQKGTQINVDGYFSIMALQQMLATFTNEVSDMMKAEGVPAHQIITELTAITMAGIEKSLSENEFKVGMLLASMEQAKKMQGKYEK